MEHNYTAAECMENLADIQFKWGDNYDKRESLASLLRASKYYKKACQPKRALIVLKRVITILELSPKNDKSVIVDKYEDCIQLYRSLDLNHLANVCHKICKSLDEEKTDFCTLNICKLESYELSMPSRVSTPSTVVTNYSDDEDSDNNDWFGGKTVKESIESKEWVQQQIRLLDQSNTCADRPHKDNREDSQQICDDETQVDQYMSQNLKSNSKLKSNQTLRKNLRQLFAETNDERIASKKAKLLIKPESELFSTPITTEITAIPVATPTPLRAPTPTPIAESNGEQQTKAKRKRRLKPKELSEESPEKRLIKLRKLDIENQFCIDPKAPTERLLCTLCDESILCYRWSIVTDHLKGRKHNDFAAKERLKLQHKDLPFNSNMVSTSALSDFAYFNNPNAKLLIKPESELFSTPITTEITAIPVATPTPLRAPTPTPIAESNGEQQLKAKRKRRLKPKELSEESPEKRLIKLRKLDIENQFCIDPKAPTERLLCTLCDESILCYRWSIVTDHLKGRKHNDFAAKERLKLQHKDLPFNSNMVSTSALSDFAYFNNPNGVHKDSGPLYVMNPPLTMADAINMNGATESLAYHSQHYLTVPSLMATHMTPINDSQQMSCSENGQNKPHDSLDTPPVMDTTSNPFGFGGIRMQSVDEFFDRRVAIESVAKVSEPFLAYESYNVFE
ncbi:unnamed protein product [Oppiella nova]|uniref:Uncharacterized protein n=1 Tax=Oppiella nova TaxID=334625 RepID=A0A7R9MDA7_9ACAR|nr:unnamed protein product [Oppiella nova]CAG2175093.1 unnamed protein product [Oppiella nova]